MGFYNNIIKSKRLIYQCYTETIEIPYFLECTEKVYQDPEYDTRFNAIYDIRHADVITRLADVTKIYQFWQKRKMLTMGKNAVITADKRSTAFVMIYNSLSPQTIKVFHDLESCFPWFNITETDISKPSKN